MGKSTHFIGQPMYNQALKLLDKSKILRISREKGGERYTKRFNGWTHLGSRKHPKWMDRLQIIDSTTISLFSNLIFKGVGRHPKTGKKKVGIKVHTVIYEIIAIYRQRWESAFETPFFVSF